MRYPGKITFPFFSVEYLIKQNLRIYKKQLAANEPNQFSDTRVVQA